MPHVRIYQYGNGVLYAKKNVGAALSREGQHLVDLGREVSMLEVEGWSVNSTEDDHCLLVEADRHYDTLDLAARARLVALLGDSFAHWMPIVIDGSYMEYDDAQEFIDDPLDELPADEDRERLRLLVDGALSADEQQRLVTAGFTLTVHPERVSAVRDDDGGEDLVELLLALPGHDWHVIVGGHRVRWDIQMEKWARV